MSDEHDVTWDTRSRRDSLPAFRLHRAPVLPDILAQHNSTENRLIVHRFDSPYTLDIAIALLKKLYDNFNENTARGWQWQPMVSYSHTGHKNMSILGVYTDCKNPQNHKYISIPFNKCHTLATLALDAAAQRPLPTNYELKMLQTQIFQWIYAKRRKKLLVIF